MSKHKESCCPKRFWKNASRRVRIMKYWIGLLDGNDPRIDFVSELDENEPGYYKVDRKESFGYQYGIVSPPKQLTS